MRLRRFALLVVLALGAAPAVVAAPLDGREVRDDIFCQSMSIAWRDSDNDPQRFGDLGGMTASLPDPQGLGVTELWMNPIFSSPACHGYQHMPANQLNTRFGTEPQFLAFVLAAIVGTNGYPGEPVPAAARPRRSRSGRAALLARHGAGRPVRDGRDHDRGAARRTVGVRRAAGGPEPVPRLDGAGRAAAPGLYLVRIAGEGVSATARLVRIR